MSKKSPDGHPPIAEARRVAQKYQLDGVIILGFDRMANKFSVTSYGQDRARCRVLAKVADQITEQLKSGAITIDWQVPSANNTQYGTSEGRQYGTF